MAIVSVIITNLSVLLFFCVVGFICFTLFIHKDDPNQAVIPRVIILFAVFLISVSYSFLAIPGTSSITIVSLLGGFANPSRSPIPFQVIVSLLLLALFFLVPAGFIYYNSYGYNVDSEKYERQGVWKLVFYYLLLIAFGLALLLGFFFSPPGVTARGVVYEDFPAVVASEVQSAADLKKVFDLNESTARKLEWREEFLTFCAYFLAFAGGFLFYCLLGVGLVALPADLIRAYRNRPHRIGYEEYKARMTRFMQRVQELLRKGESIEAQLQKRSKLSLLRSLRSGCPCGGGGAAQSQAEFETDYNALLEEYKYAKLCYEYKRTNLLVYFSYLTCAVVALLFNTALVTQVVVSVLLYNWLGTGGAPFLGGFALLDEGLWRANAVTNGSLQWLTVLVLALVVLLAQASAVSGLANLWVLLPRSLIPFELKLHESYADGLLVNCWCALLGVLPLVDLVCLAFRNSVGLSYAANLFLRWRAEENYYFWVRRNNVFEIIMLAAATVSVVRLALRGHVRAGGKSE